MKKVGQHVMHDITGVKDQECCTPAPHRSRRRLIGRHSALVALALMGEASKRSTSQDHRLWHTLDVKENM